MKDNERQYGPALRLWGPSATQRAASQAIVDRSASAPYDHLRRRIYVVTRALGRLEAATGMTEARPAADLLAVLAEADAAMAAIHAAIAAIAASE